MRDKPRSRGFAANQRQEPDLAHPTYEQGVRDFAAWLYDEFDETQREHLGEMAEEFIAHQAELAK